MVTLANAQMEEELERHRLHAEGPLSEASDDSVSDVEDQEDLENAISQIVPAEERRQTEVRNPDDFEQHRLSGKIHLIADDSKCACGRVRSVNHLPVEAVSVLGVPVCEQCRSSHIGVAKGLS